MTLQRYKRARPTRERISLPHLTETYHGSRQTAPYSPELEPDIVLTQPHASGVDETCTRLVIAEGGSIPLHWMAELIAFSTWVSYGGNRAECSAGCQRRGIVMPLMKGKENFSRMSTRTAVADVRSIIEIDR